MIRPNPLVDITRAHNLRRDVADANERALLTTPELKLSGAAAIEKYIDQRDKLWKELLLNQSALSAIAVNLLKDRNDFVEAIFRFKKIISSMFPPERIRQEQQRNKICEVFVDQLQKEIQDLIRSASTL